MAHLDESVERLSCAQGIEAMIPFALAGLGGIGAKGDLGSFAATVGAFLIRLYLAEIAEAFLIFSKWAKAAMT